MSDPRYSTSLWQKTRKCVIARDQACMLQTSPRCNGRAETAHHVIPSSARPDLFFDLENLQASCKPCNYAHGAQVKAANARAREAELRGMVEELWQEVDHLRERLSRYETLDGKPRERPQPAIY